MRRPLPPLAAALAVGIALADRMGGHPVGWASLAAAGLAAALVLSGGRARRAGLLFGFAAIGATLLSLAGARGLPADHVLRRAPPDDAVMIEGALRSPPRPVGEGRWRVDLDADLLEGRDGIAPASGGVRVTLAGRPDRTLAPGDRVRLRARVRAPSGFRVPGAPDRAAILAGQGVQAVAWLEDPRGLVRLAAGSGRVLDRAVAARIASVRAVLDATAETEADADARALLGALALGEGTALPRDLRAAFDATGTSHLLAVSGLHLGLVAALVYGLLLSLFSRSERLLLRFDVPGLAALCAIPAAWAYAVLTGASAPTLRAAVMATCVLGVRAAGRVADTISAVALAAILLLAARPAALFEPAFQLSFAAVLGVVLGAPLLTGPVPARGPLRAILLLLVASITASLATAPIVAWHFHRAAPLSPIANLLVVPPVAFVLLPLALALAILAPWPAIAEAVAEAALVVADGVAALARIVADVPLGGGPVPPPNALELVLWYACLVLAWLGAREGARRALPALLACMAILAADLAWWQGEPERNETLRADFLDVGQGDAALLRMPGGGAVLVDAGGAPPGAPDPGELAVAPALLALRVRALDLVVVTHPHRDHCAGLRAVLLTLPVARVWTNGDPGGDAECAMAFDEAAAAGVDVDTAVAGRTLRLGRGCELRVLHPQAPGDDDLSVNDRSLVVMADCGPGARVLMAGDVEEAAEARMVGRLGRAGLHADVLKAPHHGSRTSSSPAFLDAVGPGAALISVGRGNRFGLPAADVVARYEAAGVAVRRTDAEGTVSWVLRPAGGPSGLTPPLPRHPPPRPPPPPGP